MTENRIPNKTMDYFLVEYEGDLLLHNPTKEDSMVISESGAIIWQLCDGERSQQEIVALLKEGYPERGDSIDSDVDDFLNEIVEWGGISIIE